MHIFVQIHKTQNNPHEHREVAVYFDLLYTTQRLTLMLLVANLTITK